MPCELLNFFCAIEFCVIVFCSCSALLWLVATRSTTQVVVLSWAISNLISLAFRILSARVSFHFRLFAFHIYMIHPKPLARSLSFASFRHYSFSHLDPFRNKPFPSSELIMALIGLHHWYSSLIPSLYFPTD